MDRVGSGWRTGTLYSMGQFLQKRSTLLDPPLSMAEICDAIASGSSLNQLCNQRKLHFGEVRRWIRLDVDRERKYEEALELRREWVAQNISDVVMNIAGFDPQDIIGPDGGYRPISEWPVAARAALVSMDCVPDAGCVKAKFADRLRAIELIGRMTGVFAEKTKVAGEKTLAELVLSAVKGKVPDENTPT